MNWNVRKRWTPCASVPYSTNRIDISSAMRGSCSGTLTATETSVHAKNAITHGSVFVAIGCRR